MNSLKLKHLGEILGITFPPKTVITNATNSTKKVKKNSIFFGLNGTRVHGSKYIEEALNLGASIAIHDDPNFKINDARMHKKIFYIKDIDNPWQEEKDINKKNCIVRKCSDDDAEVNIYNKLLVFLCALNSGCKFISLSKEGQYYMPSFNGFTGTNGKTTSAYMAYQLEDGLYRDDQSQSIYIGTLGFQYSYQDESDIKKTKNFDTSISKNTTPDIFEIFEILNKISDDSYSKKMSQIDLEYFKETYDDEYLNEYNLLYTTINIEVSSHSLDQGRLKYIPFSKAVLMNIGSDHLDYHKSIYGYEKSKLKIFDLVHLGGEKYIGIDTVNKNSIAFKEYFADHEMPITISFVDESADIYCQINKPINRSKENTFKLILNKVLKRCITGIYGSSQSYSSHHSNEIVYVDDVKSDIYTNLLREEGFFSIAGGEIEDNWPNSLKESSKVEIQINNPDKNYIVNLFPEFNIHNLVFSIAMSIGPTSNMFYHYEAAGLEHEELLDELYELYPDVVGFKYPINLSKHVQLPPGRMQIINDVPANVIIDYAHNAEGFDFFLSSIKIYFEKLVIVFGCGGDRDKSKRPRMLATAIKYGSKVIFTSDNSRSEDFKDIFSDASNGNNIKNVMNIEDRKEAIIEGTKLIGDNGCLVILGKGHEETQEINGKSFYFSDHEVVNEIYK